MSDLFFNVRIGLYHFQIGRNRPWIRISRNDFLPVLIDAKITKAECYRILLAAGLTLPRVYAMGYPNANCIGCVKATSPTYWNHVRAKHPDVFAARAEQSRRLGARLVRVNNERLFLDELDPASTGKPMAGMDFECGLFCEEGTA